MSSLQYDNDADKNGFVPSESTTTTGNKKRKSPSTNEQSHGKIRIDKGPLDAKSLPENNPSSFDKSPTVVCEIINVDDSPLQSDLSSKQANKLKSRPKAASRTHGAKDSQAASGPRVLFKDEAISIEDDGVGVDGKTNNAGDDDEVIMVELEREEQSDAFSLTNHLRHRDTSRLQEWTDDQTNFFYVALQREGVGTDFEAMARLFKGERTQKQLERKFRAELSRNPTLVAIADALHPSNQLRIAAQFSETRKKRVNAPDVVHADRSRITLSGEVIEVSSDGAAVDTSSGRCNNTSSVVASKKSDSMPPEPEVIDLSTDGTSSAKRKGIPLKDYLPATAIRALPVNLWAGIKKLQDSEVPPVLVMLSQLSPNQIEIFLKHHEFRLNTDEKTPPNGGGSKEKDSTEMHIEEIIQHARATALYNRIIGTFRRRNQNRTGNITCAHRHGDAFIFDWEAAKLAMAEVTKRKDKIAKCSGIVMCDCTKIEMEHLYDLCTDGYLDIEIVDSFAWSFKKLQESKSKATVHSANISATLQHMVANWRKAHPNVGGVGNKDVLFELDRMCFFAQSMVASDNYDGCHLFPQCNNNHWWLLAVDMSAKKIYSFDSIGNQCHKSDAAILCSFLKVGMTVATNPTIPSFQGWKYTRSVLPDTLQQTDGTNCGVFVCYYMANIMRHGKAALTDYSLLTMPAGELHQLRGYIFSTVMNSGQVIE